MRFDVTLWNEEDALALWELLEASGRINLCRAADDLMESIRKQRTKRKKQNILWAKMTSNRQAILKALNSSSGKLARIPELPDQKTYKVGWLRVCGYPKKMPKVTAADLRYFIGLELLYEVENSKEWSEYEGREADFRYSLYALSAEGRDLVKQANASGAD